MSNFIKSFLWQEVYDIQTPTSLHIYDPWYFDKLDDSSVSSKTKDRLKKLILLKENIPSKLKAKLVFQKLLIEGWNLYVADIIIATEDKLTAYIDKTVLAEDTTSERELVCDTAKYCVSVWHGDDMQIETIHTGIDGCYGGVSENKDGLSFAVEISFPIGDMEENEIRNILAYLFRCEEIKQN